MIQIEQIPAPPSALRDAYLDSLVAPQEQFLELHVEAGKTWCVEDTAYVVRSGRNLVEFYVVPEQADRIIEIFNAAMAISNSTGVMCKSYDMQTLYAALSRPAKVRSGGLLFRRIVDPTYQPRNDIAVRQGSIADAEKILNFNEGFFDSLEEIKEYIDNDALFVLDKDGIVAGCGIGKPVIENRTDIDIGMLVAKEHRLNGYGSHIASFLKHHYIKQGSTPICGCGPTNIGSQKSLNNAGFISEHRLLEISYQV